MGAIDTAIRNEIVRLAKREARKISAPLREELKRLKNRDAERKTRIAALDEQIRKLQAKERLSETATKAEAGEVKGRLSPRLIRSLRKKLGLSQNAFAGLLNVSAISVGKWETGKMNPRPEMRAKILSFRGMKRREAKGIVENLLQSPTPKLKKKAPIKASKGKPVVGKTPNKRRVKRGKK